MTKKKTVYICHKYGGLEENKLKIEEFVKKLVKMFPDHVFISPVHSFIYLYHELEYNAGMEHCIALLDMCDEMWICSDDSRGVVIERDYCAKNKKPYIRFYPDTMLFERAC